MFNAINYSPDSATVFIQAFSKADELNFVIMDEGSGFPDIVLNGNLQPFVLGQEQSDQVKGLGLNMVKLIMDSHSGSIELANRDEGGAMVTLIFKGFDL